MDKPLGQYIAEYRDKIRVTQDQFGLKYDVSGPAIFKFEKGYVRPSLALWLRISPDMGIPERKAVLLHVRSKLPSEFYSLINPDSKPSARKRKAKGPQAKDYRSITDAKALKSTARRDATLPKGLRDLLADDELWESFQPTGKEIEILRDGFGSLGRGSKVSFREALRLVREFTGAV